jgi:4-amino-4-deoxy-L-arabinose transferase
MRMNRLPNRLKSVLLPCLVLLAVTLPHLEQGDFRRDTGRYAAVGLHMWTDGPFLVPYLNPQTPYFNKPPLGLWIHGAFLKTFGVRLTVARVPSVLAALGVVCLSVLTAMQIGSRAEAVVSGCVLALTYEFFRRTREISLDFWQLFFVMWAAYLVVTGAKSARRWPVVVAGFPLGLALLCKPFVALGVIPMLALWLSILGRARWMALLPTAALPLALLVAAPWHFYMWRLFGDAFLKQYLFHEVVQRAQGELQTVQTGPLYYYAAAIANSYWPWLAAIVFEGWRRWRGRTARQPSRDLALLGGVWCGWTLVLLSLFPDKRINYALPLYPMLSWAAAAGLCRLPWRAFRRWYRSGFAGLAPAAVAALLALSVAPIQFQEPPNKDWQALCTWMDRESVAPNQICQRELDPDEICYFYIKRGWWPARCEPMAQGLRWVLTKEASEHDERSVIFRAGALLVVQAPANRP